MLSKTIATTMAVALIPENRYLTDLRIDSLIVQKPLVILLETYVVLRKSSKQRILHIVDKEIKLKPKAEFARK